MSGSTITASLVELSKGKLNEDSASYLADVVSQTLSTGADEQALYHSIGSFLWDSNLINRETEGLAFCGALLARVCGNSESVSDDADKEWRMSKGVTLKDLIACKARGLNGEEALSAATATTTSSEKESEADEAKEGYDDPFLGLEKVSTNFNAFIPIDDSLKIAKAVAKKREKQLRMMREWEKSKVPLPAPKRRHGDAQTEKLTDILIHNFSVAVAGRELLKDATLKLVMGRHYGLIGRNGIGKTTFLSALVRGEIHGIPNHCNIGCVEQESHGIFDLTPLECVLKVDEERESLIAEEKRLTKEAPTDLICKRLTWLYARLQEIEADKAESEACQILAGLGLSKEMYREKKISELSGGWRMRVLLARVLFASPDVVCLDEPTNHLDLHAVAWLTEHVRKSKTQTFIIVSHAREFLNDVCTDVIEFRDRQLKYWTGNYDVFEKTKTEKTLQQNREAERVAAKRAHMMKFVDQNRCSAATAAMAQSRLKAIAKLPMIEAVTEDPSLQFKFANPTALPTPMLLMQGACFNWDPVKAAKKDYLIQNIDFTADLTTRAAICGVNGSGKSTFLKVLLGQVEANEGLIFRHNRLKIGYFAQHHVDNLDLTKNAVQQLQSTYPEAKLTDEAARGFFGKFGISGMMALEPLFILSGGQKSRVAIAIMAFAEPHILVLDEPTNHLDLDAIQALIAALNTFEGGVVVVSHDTHLLTCVVDDVWHMNPTTRTLEKFKGDFDQYKARLLRTK